MALGVVLEAVGDRRRAAETARPGDRQVAPVVGDDRRLAVRLDGLHQVAVHVVGVGDLGPIGPAVARLDLARQHHQFVERPVDVAHPRVLAAVPDGLLLLDQVAVGVVQVRGDVVERRRRRRFHRRGGGARARGDPVERVVGALVAHAARIDHRRDVAPRVGLVGGAQVEPASVRRLLLQVTDGRVLVLRDVTVGVDHLLRLTVVVVGGLRGRLLGRAGRMGDGERQPDLVADDLRHRAARIDDLHRLVRIALVIGAGDERPGRAVGAARVRGDARLGHVAAAAAGA